MYDFADVRATNKSEQVRAWAVEQAIDSSTSVVMTDGELILRANEIEKFILNGMQEDKTDAEISQESD